MTLRVYPCNVTRLPYGISDKVVGMSIILCVATSKMSIPPSASDSVLISLAASSGAGKVVTAATYGAGSVSLAASSGAGKVMTACSNLRCYGSMIK